MSQMHFLFWVRSPGLVNSHISRRIEKVGVEILIMETEAISLSGWVQKMANYLFTVKTMK